MSRFSWPSRKRQSLKRSAAQRGIEFLLSSEEIKNLFEGAGEKCSVCGCQYEQVTDKAGTSKSPCRSVDRIDNRYGYVLENVRIICAGCNTAKSIDERNAKEKRIFIFD